MYFDDWEIKGNGKKISSTLLWEYDLTDFDWQAMRTTVVARVLERGWPDDFYAALTLYGGMDNFRNIIKEIPYLSDRDVNFACMVFNLKKEELKCYRRRQSRERLLNS